MKEQSQNSQTKKSKIPSIMSLIGLIISIFVCVWAWKKGILTEPERMAEWIKQFGFLGPIIFVIFQGVQVVFPVIPGGIGLLAGGMMFGTFLGFLYNYIGICLGSMGAFGIAKKLGTPVLQWMFSEKQINKYQTWMNKGGHFTKLFAFLIFIPVAPDDFLCYLAGTTNMSWKHFTIIIWTCKPFAIFTYTWGLRIVFNFIVSLLK